MTFNSLALRLIAASALWALIMLAIAGYVLNSIYRDRVEDDFDTRLGELMTLLVAASALDEGNRPVAPKGFGDALFDLPIANGWYWQIEPYEDGGDWRLMSNSLVGEPLRLPEEAPAVNASQSFRLFNVSLPDGQDLRVARRLVRINSDGRTYRYLYTLTGNRNEIAQNVGSFANKIALSLAVLGIGLVAVTLLQVRFGLRPLRRIERGLSRIRSGEAERLEGRLPIEITPLQTELNALIKSNQAIIERARTQVGNLAHALKTPLSVITNEANAPNTNGEKVREQAELMRDQINHYLDRARMAATAGIIGGTTDSCAVAESITRALERIYEGRKLQFTRHCSDDATFQGEKQDLEEMLGNLLDNACKWAASRIDLDIRRGDQPDSESGRPMLTVLVDDDGPGLTAEQRASAVKRGNRLDETKPGSGLGLSIVRDLADLYRGTLKLEQSPGGGLRARLSLPAAERRSST